MQNNKPPVKTPKKTSGKKWKTVQKRKKPRPVKKDKLENENQFFDFHDRTYQHNLENQNEDTVVLMSNENNNFQESTNLMMDSHNSLLTEQCENDYTQSLGSWGDYQT